MAKTTKGAASSSPEPLEDLDLDEALPALDEEPEAPASENSTINLDEYGIWVKAEPEDFKANESFDEQEMELEDLSLDETGQPAGQSASGNADLIDNLDIPEEESLAIPGAADADDSLELTIDDDATPISDNLEEDSLEDISLEAEPRATGSAEEDTLEEVSLEEESLEGIPAMEDMEDDVTLNDDLSSLEEEPATVETVVRDEETPATAPGSAASYEETSPSSLEASGDFEDVSLDDLGIEISPEAPAEDTAKVAAKRKPSAPAPAHSPAPADEGEAHVIDDDFASLSLELDGDEDGDQPVEDKGGLELDDLELPMEEPIADGAEETIAAEDSDDLAGSETLEEIPELELGSDESFGLEIETDEGGEEIEVPLSEDVAIADADSEDDLESLADEPRATAASPSILSKIEAELRSIKTELTQLKSELGQLRGSKSAAAAGGPGAQAGSAGKTKAEDSADFFEEEEDETIALTGEELDNILTTADIKEENKTEAAPESVPEEDAGLDLGEDILSYDETPLEEEQAPAAAEEDLISFDEEPVAEAVSAPSDGEIEIEIPELESGPEADSAGLDDDLEAIGEFGPEAGLESSDASGLDDSLEEVGELELEPAGEVATGPGRGPAPAGRKSDMQLSPGLKEEIKSVLGYMDQLLESLPEEKIEEFAKSEYFSIYKKLFEELGLVS